MDELNRCKLREVIKVKTLSQKIERINVEISQAEKGHLSDLKGRKSSNVYNSLLNESDSLIMSCNSHLKFR